MYKLFEIAKNNIKKQKGDMVTFFILTFIAAFLIFDGASAIIGLGRVMDEKFSEINGAHVMLINPDTEEEKKSAEKAFEENEHITDFEMTPAVMLNCEYKNKNDKDFMEFEFIAEDFNVKKTIMNVPRPGSGFEKDEILLPYNLANRFKEGDTIRLKMGDDTYDLKVAGFLEDPYFCSTINLTIFSVNMSDEILDEMVKDQPMNATRMNINKGRIDESILTSDYTTSDLEKEITDAYKDEIAVYSKENPEANYSNYLSVNWQMMRGGSQFIPEIVVAVILMFAVLIMIISFVIISFSVKNFIQKNMKNTGILEACGYTVMELRLALVIQIVLVAIIGSVIGVAVGILTFESFGEIVSSVLGLTWNQPINPGVAFATVLGITALLGFVAILISRAFKKITVLDALRGGINAHNFKRNIFSFEKSPLPVSLTLALKDTFGSFGRNLIMVFIAAVLSISTMVGFGMYENFGISPKTLVRIMGFEMPTVSVNTEDSADYASLAKDLGTVPGVKNVLVQTGFEPTAVKGDKEESIYTYVVDDMDKTDATIVLEGRTQEKENEIMVTSGVAKDLGLKVGDVLTIKFSDKEAEYIVVGINQRMERMGRTIYMTIDGAKRIVPGEMVYTYCMYGDDNVSFDEIKTGIDKLSDEKGLNLKCSDSQKMMLSTIDALTLSMKLLNVLIVIITILIVIFVESLVIRAKIGREWKNMGISKALGQTSGGIATQIMLSNMPSILIGTILGALLAKTAGSGICKAAFSLFAMKEVTFNISPIFMLITVIGIVAVAMLTAGAEGLKVRKLRPVEMITEE